MAYDPMKPQGGAAIASGATAVAGATKTDSVVAAEPQKASRALEASMASTEQDLGMLMEIEREAAAGDPAAVKAVADARAVIQVFVDTKVAQQAQAANAAAVVTPEVSAAAAELTAPAGSNPVVGAIATPDVALAGGASIPNEALANPNQPPHGHGHGHGHQGAGQQQHNPQHRPRDGRLHVAPKSAGPMGLGQGGGGN